MSMGGSHRSPMAAGILARRLGLLGGCLPDACVPGVDGQLMPHGRPRVCSETNAGDLQEAFSIVDTFSVCPFCGSHAPHAHSSRMRQTHVTLVHNILHTLIHRPMPSPSSRNHQPAPRQPAGAGTAHSACEQTGGGRVAMPRGNPRQTSP